MTTSEESDNLLGGTLHVLVNNNWYLISNLGFKDKLVQMTCKYFKLGGGFLNLFQEKQQNELIHFMIDCKNATILENCRIRYVDGYWLNRLKISYVDLRCSYETPSGLFSTLN